MKVCTVLAVLAMVSSAMAVDYTQYNSGSATPGASYTIPGAEGGTRFHLLYDDRPPGHDGITQSGAELAAIAAGYTTTVVGDSGSFANALASPPLGGWDHVYSGHHNFSGPQAWENPLVSYIQNNGLALLEDWRSTVTNPTYDNALGFDWAGPNNWASVTGAAVGVTAGGAPPSQGPRFGTVLNKTSPPPGWGIYATSLVNAAIPGSGLTETKGVSSSGSLAVAAGASGTGRYIASGTNSDTIGGGLGGAWSPAISTDFYGALYAQVPEPTTVGLLALGALVSLRRRR